MSQPASTNVPAPIIALASWVLPGSGYVMIGQRSRGITIGLSILTLFLLGLFIGGVGVIDPPARFNQPLNAVLDKPWYVGQVLTGPVTFIAAMARDGRTSHGRSFEIGTLYTAVAGMLNLLAAIDATYRSVASARNPDRTGGAA